MILATFLLRCAMLGCYVSRYTPGRWMAPAQIGLACVVPTSTQQRRGVRHKLKQPVLGLSVSLAHERSAILDIGFFLGRSLASTWIVKRVCAIWLVFSLSFSIVARQCLILYV